MKVREDKNSTSPTELREPASPDSGSGVELLPCPFCGDPMTFMDPSRPARSLVCHVSVDVKCVLSNPLGRLFAGPAEWNTRTAPAITATQADEAGENATLATQNSAVPSTQTGDQLSADPWVYLETRYQTQVKVGKYTIGAHWAGLGDPNEIKTIMRRISAVPDLLTFADAYRRSLTNRSESDMSAPEMELLNMADAAIAKAAGEKK